ncbi:MAG: response regulator [Candidatus Tectomicrobia bacterium]|uniref:Response regulator n=1 Tax=Tectimicrobiota bacterium TaxID=2528274 RepID=A0A932CNY7_UNCTE|nr:response regulator [Candidatus Tectomicrobia bacterium]
MILVADDEKGIREVFVEFLGLYGYPADAVENGEKALNAFDEKKYRMLITDKNMPVMDGIELIRNIKQRCPRFPIIAVTGDSTEELIEAGATRCFTKPFDLDKLRTAIQEILRPCA